MAKEKNKQEIPVGFEEVSRVQYWKPEHEGDSLEGTVIDVRESRIEGKDAGKQYIIETPKKEVWSTPSNADVQGKMANVKVGEYVRLVYEGEDSSQRKEGQNAPKIYRVYRKK